LPSHTCEYSQQANGEGAGAARQQRKKTINKNNMENLAGGIKDYEQKS
jgi:hypothetical protein